MNIHLIGNLHADVSRLRLMCSVYCQLMFVGYFSTVTLFVEEYTTLCVCVCVCVCVLACVC